MTTTLQDQIRRTKPFTCPQQEACLGILTALDDTVLELHRRQLGTLDQAEIQTLTRLLDRIRAQS